MWGRTGGGGCGCGCGGWRGRGAETCAEGSNVGLVGWAARSAASGKRKRPPAQRKIFGFHNPHYRFPDTELSGIRARTPRQNTDFVPGISDFWRSAAVSAPQAKILRFRTPLDTCGRRARRSAPSASPKKILRFRGQFDHFGAGCGGCGGLGRGCGCEALRARWMWMCGVPRAISAGCVWALRHPSGSACHRLQ